ncbi:ferritin-like domain-containing protein [Lichenicola cladoniae]|uniref:Ferritin-like domain-containing protein n=1 Tax=Lichenicola cladoniae TaxID=1484109 RepID=A0A6M8HWV8_9PROT|nr:ferritin-like domain-containing protein [Lichenicola cladoniae]NPD65528.1 ferritin-like domain-containing protein [Acetobacteraceae bacterium]QKE92726.1 ferritin-like domain-containing protein [Lichenicola cladoniae]
MKHWRIEDVSWDRFDPALVDLDVLRMVKAASVVERNGLDYAVYLNNVFTDDPDFKGAVDNWAIEEVQHGDALGHWAMLADPGWDYPSSFERYRSSYHIPLEVDASVRGSRTGELIARCMVETGTSSFYTAMAEATEEPVLKLICKQIAADEYRHFKLFYDHMHRYLKREKLGVMSRTRIALGRITESEDDELAYAYHCTNEGDGVAYDHKRCIAAYMSRAMGFYRRSHIERAMGMMFKTIGFTPHGRVSKFAARMAFAAMQARRRKFARIMARRPATVRRPQTEALATG